MASPTKQSKCRCNFIAFTWQSLTGKLVQKFQPRKWINSISCPTLQPMTMPNVSKTLTNQSSF